MFRFGPPRHYLVPAHFGRPDVENPLRGLR
jgi:hypothetical protein